MRLRGQMSIEQRLGPPGFGETPGKDAKLSIVLLHLEVPLDTCAASFSDAQEPDVRGLTVMQIKGNVDPEVARRMSGKVVDAYGWLDPGTGSNDFTRIVLWADSISALTFRDGSRVASVSSP
ncbi:MAG TPA: hypothetical protein VI159_08730 [Gemmatimonadales bacterium]